MIIATVILLGKWFSDSLLTPWTTGLLFSVVPAIALPTGLLIQKMYF
jgi:hypothetical protein